MKMFLRASLALLAVCGLLFPCFGRAKVLATAGGEKITDADFDLKVKEAEAKQGHALSSGEKTDLLKALLNQRLLVAEARAQGLEKDKQIKEAIADGTRQVLANTLFDREVTSKVRVGDEDIKNFYKNNPQALEMARASQILIKVTPALNDEKARKKAEDIYRAVKGDPAKFADAARRESDDPVSRERGGDLGSFGRGAMVPEFDKAVFQAKAGDFIAPVKTSFGYHIIYVVEKRLPSLDESASAISQELTRRQTAQAQKDYLEKLAKKFKAKVLEDAVH